MQLVAVNGSPHGAQGGTARIAAWLFEECRRHGVSIVEYNLTDLAIHHCNGCGHCMNQGSCIIDDDVRSIHEAWSRADLIVWVCPTHVFHVTSIMKAFVDRTAGEFHRPSLEGKYAAVVTSSAGMGESEVVRYLGNCLEILGAAVVGSVWGTFRPPTRLWEPEAVQARAQRLGSELIACAREQRQFPHSDQVISQRRFLRELIWRNRKIFKADYAYWKDRDWFDPKTDQK
jgi:multimeric flavodoxin WrbA